MRNRGYAQYGTANDTNEILKLGVNEYEGDQTDKARKRKGGVRTSDAASASYEKEVGMMEGEGDHT
jgi:hypothetical protein